MFTVLVTEAFGASAAIQGQYLIERRLDTALAGELVLQVRERTTGIRRWLKCGDGSPQAAERLAEEMRILSRLSHAHLLLPLPRPAVEDEASLLYPWRAEQPLSWPSLAQVAPPDRVRLAQALLETITYLHGLEQPVLHGSPAVASLWIVPGVNWLRLAGFGQVRAAAAVAELESERRQMLDLCWRVVGGGENAAAAPENLSERGAQWVSDPLGAFAALNAGLKQEFLTRVTADL